MIFLGPLYVDASEPTEAAPGSVWTDSASSPTFFVIKNEDGNWDDLGAVASLALSVHLADTVAAHDASAIAFTPDGSISATDVQAAIVEVRDEASAIGHETEVVEVTKTSNYPVTSLDTGSIFTNEGASGGVLFTLPAGGDGLIFTFLCVTADTLSIDTDTTDIIYLGSSETGTTGNINTSDVGAAVTLVGVAGGWYARSYTGSWSVV